MTVRSLIKRAGVVTAASTALVLTGATAASAHHCYVPMYSLNGPTSSANWLVITAEDGAALIAGFSTDCDEARDAGYAALEEAGMPLGIKIFEKMTIGAGMQEVGQGWTTSPNGADGKGLEYFGAGSTLADEMLTVYIAGASAVDCSGTTAGS